MLGGMLGHRLFASTFTGKSSLGQAKKNVIFVMTDQWRYHAQGFVRQDPVRTPCLDQFASRSFNFRNAIASSPVCCPNRACWMTGRFHQGHGVMKNEDTHVQPEQILVSNFKREGYSTAYIGKWHLSGGAYPRAEPTPDFLKRDFDFWYRVKNHTHFQLEYDDHGEMKNFGRGWQPGHEVAKAIEYLKEPRDNPFFWFSRLDRRTMGPTREKARSAIPLGLSVIEKVDTDTVPLPNLKNPMATSPKAMCVGTLSPWR